MRSLSPSLLAAQQSSGRTPCAKIEAKNKMTGVTTVDWERLYTGTESEYYHGAAFAGDGSLIRVRISLAADSNRLYRQRVAVPGPTSDFSLWTYTNQYSCLCCAAAAYGSEVSIVWINSSREIRRLKSIDNGVTWGNPELLDYSVSTTVLGLSAVYKPNGDIVIFFSDQASLRVKKCAGGIWQTKTAWDKTTGVLSSVAAVYDADWKLLVTGLDTDGSYKLWSLVYGDGGTLPVNTWSALKEVASAPAGGDYEYAAVFADKPDVYRAFFVEKYKGGQSYNRPYWTYAVPVTGLTDSFWREPVPFNQTCQYGLAAAHYGGYCWLSTANGVWRGALASISLDISNDVVAVKQENLPNSAQLLVELRNDDNRYQFPGGGIAPVIPIGSQIEISPGYTTPQGKENSPGNVFWLEGWEYTSAPGKSTFTLRGIDGWELLKNWHARHQFRWNKDTGDTPVKTILAFVLARAGLQLEVKSQSAPVTGFCPDFTIHPGDSGEAIIGRLLALVPDLLFMEGIKAYLVYPQTADSAAYVYGQAHQILQGKYTLNAWQVNQLRVEGSNPVGGAPVVTDTFSWEQMDFFNDRMQQITDRNIATAAAGTALAGARLRKAEIDSIGGHIRVPANCGQQLFDVIEINDPRAGLTGIKRRVIGIALSYRPERSEYEQTIWLGGV